MKIDIAWLIIAIIFISCIVIILNKLRKDYQETRKIVYQLFTESESKRIMKMVESAVHDEFSEAKRELSQISKKD